MEAEFGERSSKISEKETSEIADFYNGRSVFVTGAAGFVGSVLLEALLRCCPGIRFIFILLREKKGIKPEERKEKIFKKRIFLKWKAIGEAVKKVKVVEGDIAHPGLGISSSDFQMISDDVSIIFHCAAVISFKKCLRYMLIQNLVGTKNVIELCKKIPKLKALVYTSTAYANCNKMVEIEETIYRLAVPAQTFVEAITSEETDDVSLKALQELCTPSWPNSYTFSKAAAENLLLENEADLPLAIVRPSIIISSWKGAVPGYTEEGSGMIDVSIGIGKGFIRVLQCDEKKIVDIIPVDIVVNTLIVASWSISTERLPSPLVVHCTSGEIAPCTWGHFISSLYHMQALHPMPRMYQKPGLVMRKYDATYWFSSFFNHYVPAYFIDMVLQVSGRKPKLVKLYKFYDVVHSYLKLFLLTEWKFCCENYKTLTRQLNTKDSELLPLDLQKYDIHSTATLLIHGAPFYQWDTDKRQITERLLLAHRRYMLTSFIKWTTILLLMVLVAFVITRVL